LESGLKGKMRWLEVVGGHFTCCSRTCSLCDSFLTVYQLGVGGGASRMLVEKPLYRMEVFRFRE